MGFTTLHINTLFIVFSLTVLFWKILRVVFTDACNLLLRPISLAVWDFANVLVESIDLTDGWVCFVSICKHIYNYETYLVIILNMHFDSFIYFPGSADHWGHSGCWKRSCVDCVWRCAEWPPGRQHCTQSSCCAAYDHWTPFARTTLVYGLGWSV